MKNDFTDISNYLSALLTSRKLGFVRAFLLLMALAFTLAGEGLVALGIFGFEDVDIEIKANLLLTIFGFFLISLAGFYIYGAFRLQSRAS